MLLLLWGAMMMQPVRATDTIRLNMQAYLKDYPQDASGKWTGTFDYGVLQMDFDIFRFSHLTNAIQTQGSDPHGMNYWDGFTLCTNGDDADYGFAGSSTDWPEHQWGCMAAGGIDSLGRLVKGAPYLVAYWGYEYEEEGVRSLQTDFSDGLTHRPLGIWVCNHPWAYYGIQHDDGFAHSFADNGALFNLIVHGLDEEGKEAGMPVVHPLATFHDNALDISSAWQWVNLKSLGQVNGLFFTMESSDMSGVLGMNTAAFFCLGGMEVLAHEDGIARPTGLEAEPLDEHRVKVKWTRVPDAAYYRLYIDSVLTDSTAANSYTFTGLQTYSSHRFFAQAVDAGGTGSDWGYVSARTKDLTPPAPPANLRAEPDMYKIRLTWDAATDNVAVDKYAVYVNGRRFSRPKYTTATVTGLDPETTYTIGVETLDTSGNASERVTIQVSTLGQTTGMANTSAETTERLYTLGGQPVTRQQAAHGQLYIVATDKQTTKQIIR